MSDDTAAEAPAGWSDMARPLGTLLLTGGLLGGAMAITSGYLRRHQPELSTPLIKFSGWAAVFLIVGIVGLVQFRKVRLPDKLVSTQTLGVWVFVALAGVLVQVIGHMLRLGPYALIPVTTLLIGIGIATLAFQTRLWLLGPALLCFATSLVLAALPHYSREILGSMLIVAVGGVGLAIRLGAPLEPPPAT
jgi:hypothetical protein